MFYYLHIVKCSIIDLPMFIWQDVYIAVSLLSPVLHMMIELKGTATLNISMFYLKELYEL